MTAALKREETLLFSRTTVADTFLSRFMGLMGKSGIPEDEAVVFPRCNSIHTFFMRFPIDVVFVDDGGEVVDVVESMRPWKMLMPRRGARHTIEMQANLSRRLGITKGTRIDCEGVWS